ncbi:DUF1822 family protein [Sodalinema gerasimenkoae]|uniref:DUF1822 family protein n=1 Tax=Sodalinema gerasimenkoae TaxID=2862348 RepID=UPI00135B33D3|nr:DUF1822 family protein [Sodalinema gerasimenkoae]
MNYSYNELTFNVPITQTMRLRATEVSQYQDKPDKSEQVYRNVLAVLAVYYYCQCMGIETRLESSYVWNPAWQVLANSADLELANLGRVECCPVAANAHSVTIAQEAQSNKIGYIAVTLDEASHEAILLGFCERLRGKGEQFSLQDWDDLEAFLSKVEDLELQSSPDPPHLTQLTQWVRGLVNEGWESLENLVLGQNLTPGWAVRGPVSSMENDRSSAIRRGKLLHFEGMDEAIALLISLDSEISEEMDISVEIQSLDRRSELPFNLEISILDEEGHSVMQALAKSSEHIKLNFSGQPQEKFGVKVALGSVSFLENFVI